MVKEDEEVQKIMPEALVVAKDNFEDVAQGEERAVDITIQGKLCRAWWEGDEIRVVSVCGPVKQEDQEDQEMLPEALVEPQDEEEALAGEWLQVVLDGEVSAEVAAGAATGPAPEVGELEQLVEVIEKVEDMMVELEELPGHLANGEERPRRSRGRAGRVKKKSAKSSRQQRQEADQLQVVLVEDVGEVGKGLPVLSEQLVEADPSVAAAMLQVVLGREEEPEVGLVATDQAVLAGQEVVVADEDKQRTRGRWRSRLTAHREPTRVHYGRSSYWSYRCGGIHVHQ